VDLKAAFFISTTRPASTMASAKPVPKDPRFEDRVRANFRRQGVMGLLGAHLSRVQAGEVEITVPFRADLSQQHGYFHAGVVATAMDSAGGYAGYTLMPADSSVLSVEFKINFMNPAQGDAVRTIGRVVKAGRTLTVCELQAYAIKGKTETLCATGIQTLIQVASRERP
jgi:uncharacterized protein (TIGR00369 family)